MKRVEQMKRVAEIRSRHLSGYAGLSAEQAFPDVAFLLEEIDRLNKDRCLLMERYDEVLRSSDRGD